MLECYPGSQRNVLGEWRRNHAEVGRTHGAAYSENQNRQNIWRARMLARFDLPATVRDEANGPVGQRRFYARNVWSEKKRLEKLNYLHNNPVQRRWVSAPGEWPWSSRRFYFLQDASRIALDRLA